MAAGKQAVLEGYEADAVNPPLRFGDGVTFIPNGCNGVAAYAGSDDARAWVEVLDDGIQVPPNLRDCHWRLVPRRVYTEAKALRKLAKKGTWDEGKCLPWPEVPAENDDLDELAQRFIKSHNLKPKQMTEVKEVLAQLQAAKEEKEGNASEEKRQAGNCIRYGDSIQVVHVSTDKYLCVTKLQAIEKGSKKVELIPTADGTELCVFVVKPAYKTYMPGEIVSSGDLVTLHTAKPVGDVLFYLHMSQLAKDVAGNGAAVDHVELAQRHLQLDGNPKVTDLQEVNAVTSSDKTFFRMLIFQGSQCQAPADRPPFLSEDMVTFYHKEAEAYLHLDMLDYNAGRNPCFRLSMRTSDKARKKSTWMFKVESEQLLDGANQVQEGSKYRIKHILSNSYLMQDGEELKATLDYTDPRCLFTFKQFDRNHQSKELFMNSLLFIRGGESDAWLTQTDEDAHEQVGDKDPAAQHDQGIATERVQERKAKFVEIDKGTPEREALLVCPVRHISKTSVVQVRRAVLVLKDFYQQIQKVEEAEDCSKPGDSPPETLPPATAKVLAVAEECYPSVYNTLRKLVVNCTIARESDPLVREGVPNRLMQKLLREADAINLVFQTIDLLFKRGLGLAWFASARVDSRLEKIHELIVLMYRLLKQLAKGDRRNSWALYQWVDLIRSHLGKGLSCNVTLKEMYLDKRQLLKKIKMDDIKQFMILLKDEKDPRYIDFLLSICTCNGEPLPENQEFVCEQLLAENNLFLPTCKVESKPGRQRLGIHLPGTYDKLGGGEFWIDVGKFNGPPIYRNGQARDIASQIMNTPTTKLNAQQKLFRYFIRCTNLYGKLALGRNQTALGLLLKNDRFAFSYDDIFQTMSNNSLPPLVRARFCTLMLRLYVDRDPQTSKPQVLYTRKWSKVVPDKDADFDMSEKALAPTNPVCTDGFKTLQEYLLKALPDLGGIKDHKTDKPAQNISGFMLGELELILAMVELCDLLVDFSFFVKERDSVEPDFSAVKCLIQGIFKILDTDGTDCRDFRDAVSMEERLRVDVRIRALELLRRLFNLRANYRISLALDSWEKLFPEVEDSFSKALAKEKKASAGKSPLQMEQAVLRRLLGGKNSTSTLKGLEKKMFNENCISPPELDMDTYKEGTAGKDTLVRVLLNLCRFNNTRLTTLASQVLIRHMAQRMRVIDDLRLSQVLVMPAAVKVYEETTFAINRLTSLKKKLAADEPAAYEEAMNLLKRMTDYMRITVNNPKDIVQKNQKIMLNRELDEPVVDLLRLNLKVDDSARTKENNIDADPATNIPLRDLFQACYDFLKFLCMHGHTKAQEKLFDCVGMFSNHMGIQGLNVADTLQEIVRDNAALCGQVKEDFYRHFVFCIMTYGRKARWLSFFNVFLSIRGNPSRRNQDMILRLLLEEKDAVIDLECDYTASPYLSKSDERTGKKRLDLLIARDHKRKVASLVKYHYVSVTMLAQCCTGRNPANKSKVSGLVPFDVILNNILQCHLKDDGKTSALEGGEVDYDAVCYVKQAWTQLMEDAFLSSFDSLAVRMVQSANRIWHPAVDHHGAPIAGAVSLMDEWLDAITRLKQRLSKIPLPKQGGAPEAGPAAAPADAAAEGGEGGGPAGGEGGASAGGEGGASAGGEGGASAGGEGESAIAGGANFGSDGAWTRGPAECRSPGTSARGLRTVTVHGSAMGEEGSASGDAEDPGAEAVLRIGLCGSDPDRDLADEEGKDLGTHYLYVRSIISALSLFLEREDMSANLGKHEFEMCQKIYNELCRLQKELVRLKLDASQSLMTLVATMTHRAIKGDESLPSAVSGEVVATEKEMTREQKFQIGWSHYKEQLADMLVEDRYEPKINLKREIRDLARLYGSSNSPANGDLKSLKLFMHLLCQDQCEADVRKHGVKIVRSVLYMNPDTIKSTSKQDDEYERYFANKDPSTAGQDDFRAFQVKVAQGGGVQVVVACMSSKDPETQLGALQLGCTLLASGNSAVQDLFYKQLSSAQSQSFFSALKAIFDSAVENIKETKRKAKQAEAMRQMAMKAGLKASAVKIVEEEENTLSALMTEVMKFMRRSCFGQHKNMQDVLRVQRANRDSFNFYLEAVQYMKALEPDIRGSIAKGDTRISESAIRGLLMLAESMRGPNPDNQQTLATSGIFDLGDRIMNKIKLVSSVPSATKGKKSKKNQVMDDEDEQDGAAAVSVKTIFAQNETRCRLKMAVLKCLHSFLEGVQSDSIPTQMLSTVDWGGYAAQMKDCYDMRWSKDLAPMPFDGTPSPDQLYNNPEGDNIVDEGISHFFLFKFLEKYQGREAGSPLTDALSHFPNAARYFEARKGYVEIIRDERLERVFFRLPEACIEDGPLNKPYDSMYGEERDDADKKTDEFLENMICLVSKEKFLDKIRASFFSFTINKWDSIMTLCFYWGGLLHLVLVLGAYAPYHGLLVTESGGQGSSKSHYTELAEDSTCEEGNCWNMFFLVKVLPLVDEIARYMCYVYAALCALRYFSFLWAHVPLIILDGASAGEAEEELDDEAGGGSEEHAEEDDAEVLFVEDLDLGGQGGDLPVEDTEEGAAGGAGSSWPGLVSSVRIVLGNPTFVYETVFVAMGALAVVFDDPLFTAFFWCDLTFFPGSQTVVNAIAFKAGEMLNTLVLGIAIMYLWMVIGILLFRENHADNNGQALCVNMFQCTLSYLMIALRGDGVADLMDDLTIPLNLVDSVSPLGEANERFFLPLLLWDFSYNWLFIYILLAIITGIVIDAFGGMREAKEAAEDNLKAVCYVCNLEKYALDQGPGFEKHVKTEHNPRWYLFFLIYIDNKRDAQLTGQEKYVKSKVWPASGAPRGDWIPRERTDSVKEESEEDPNSALHDRMDQLEEKVCSALERIEGLLSSKDGANEDAVKDRNGA